MIYNSKLRQDIELTPERKGHILLYHPDLKLHFSKFKQALLSPTEIRVSKSDPKVLLFYKQFARIGGEKYIAIVVKFDKRNFILTAYLTNRILSGEKYEQPK